MKTIKLSKGLETIIDDEDFELLNQHTWHCTSHGYAATNTGGRLAHKVIYLHRLLIKTKKGEYVDHISGDKLDNRRSNLRAVNPHQSRLNTGSKSKQRLPKGVSYLPGRRKPYRVNINYVSIGYFETVEQASMAYDLWAVDLYGKYGKTNHSLNVP